MDTGNGQRFTRGYAPITHIIGKAGRTAYEELDEPQPEWSAYRENSTYGWTLWEYDGEARELYFTHYRIDGSIGDEFVLQEAPLLGESDDKFLGLPGFSAMLPILDMMGAAVRLLR